MDRATVAGYLGSDMSTLEVLVLLLILVVIDLGLFGGFFTKVGAAVVVGFMVIVLLKVAMS